MRYDKGVLYLDVTIQTDNFIDVDIGSSVQTLDFSIEANKDARLPYYEGEYLVEPRKVGQTLDTSNKSMSEDVVINPIYYAETTNIGGGYTAIIGKE